MTQVFGCQWPMSGALHLEVDKISEYNNRVIDYTMIRQFLFKSLWISVTMLLLLVNAEKQRYIKKNFSFKI